MSPDNAKELELGRRIYNSGILSSGAELTGTRPGGALVTGADAACVICHRRSGMGQVEADILVQPIAGNFLFANSNEKHLATMDPHVSKRFNQAHAPYTDTSLSAAIRNGINVQGHEMSELMPRYGLSDLDLKALTAYLKQLSSQWSPGVTDTTISFATVITPDVDPARRKVFIDMMQSIFLQKNRSTVTTAQGRTRRHMTTAAEMVLGTERSWNLDIWELQGEPGTWGAQLADHYRKHPVFALVSGVSDSTWQPVHDFCDHEQVPCWFPSVNLPGEKQSQYAFYFSAGVKLESNVLARHLLNLKERPRHLIQIYREDQTGLAASKNLSQALSGSGIAVSDHPLSSDQDTVNSIRRALNNLTVDDAVMFWLRPDDIEPLTKIVPGPSRNYFSAALARGDYAIVPDEWKAHAFLVYPYELPENRQKNLDYFHAWLHLSKIPLVDEPMQSEVFFAMNFMTDTLSEMLDNIYRDYLVERAESMLSRRESMKSAQENRDRVALGRSGDMLRKHGANTVDESARIQIPTQVDGFTRSQGTTLYPHLSLGADQRFASKGAYIVRFSDVGKNPLKAETDLIVP